MIKIFIFSRLVEKLDNMKKNAMGNGSTQCVLCGDEFGLLGASPTFCDDCRKVCKQLPLSFFFVFFAIGRVPMHSQSGRYRYLGSVTGKTQELEIAMISLTGIRDPDKDM